MSKLSGEKFDHMSRLAMFNLSANERENLLSEVAQNISIADNLENVDVEGVPITMHAVDMQSVFRKDVCEPSMDRDLLLKNSKEHDGMCFIVPKVLD